MDRREHARWCALGLLLLALLGTQALAASARPSALSRWLSLDAGADLERKLTAHPRYEAQRLLLVNRSGDALAEAVARVLQSRLQPVARVETQAAGAGPLPTGLPGSIDVLACAGRAADYRLEVVVTPRGGRAAVELSMVDVAGGVLVERWQWQGQLNQGEREYAGQRVETASPGGPETPWEGAEVAAVAAALSRQFACDLRPHTATLTTLAWEAGDALPSALANTVNVSRHLLGAFRELDVVGEAADADYRVQARAHPFGDGVWQLWLAGIPVQPGRPAVQAVTYISAGDAPETPAPSIAQRLLAAVAGPAARLGSAAADPADFLQVELMGVTRSEYGDRANLSLRLRLQNRGDQPLAYGLRSSGGHFRGCMGSRDHYRHQAWGRLSGVLQPGEIRIDLLRIPGVSHRPTGVGNDAACAGFGDLAVFEDYRRRGPEVTEYLRWEM